MKITNKLFRDVLALDINEKFVFDGLGLLATDDGNNLLSFILHKKYIAKLNSKPNIRGVFCTKEIAETGNIREDIKVFAVDDPSWYFFSLVDYLGRNKERTPSIIDPSSIIHPTAVISPVGVIIGKNCKIGSNVVILQDVIIEDDVSIRTGCIIGEDGFEHKKTSNGILSVTHDGEVLIKKHVEIGPNSCVAKGFSYRKTIIGVHTKLDTFIHYAHGVQCGSQCLIASKAMIAGNVTIGDNVWIGPSAVISNRVTLHDNSNISLGAVVINDVPAGATVTGNFAVPHMKFLRNFKKVFLND